MQPLDCKIVNNHLFMELNTRLKGLLSNVFLYTIASILVILILNDSEAFAKEPIDIQSVHRSKIENKNILQTLILKIDTDLSDYIEPESFPTKEKEKPKYLVGGDGIDKLIGGSGNDHLTGGNGADYLNGKEGYDYVRYDDVGSKNGVVVNLSNPSLNTGRASGDKYISIEGIVGSNFDDSLYGDIKSNDINGFDGDDVIEGGGGPDVYNGGSGNDTFVLKAGETNGVVILQLDNSEIGKDIIEFRNFGKSPSIIKKPNRKWLVTSDDGTVSETFSVLSGSENVLKNYFLTNI
jgi:hypothetical protein